MLCFIIKWKVHLFFRKSTFFSESPPFFQKVHLKSTQNQWTLDKTHGPPVHLEVHLFPTPRQEKPKTRRVASRARLCCCTSMPHRLRTVCIVLQTLLARFMLPVSAFDTLSDILGINASMDSFVGRTRMRPGSELAEPQ